MNDLIVFFSKQLEDLECDDITRAYIISIFTKYKTSIDDLSKDSITLLYSEAKFRADFVLFNNIGDWLFLCNSIFPEHLNATSQKYYISIGQSSYYSCYKLLNKQMKLFEMMADNFNQLSLNTRKLIRGSSNLE